jgi:hypothetical protein
VLLLVAVVLLFCCLLFVVCCCFGGGVWRILQLPLVVGEGWVLVALDEVIAVVRRRSCVCARSRQVSAEPEIHVEPRKPAEDLYLVLACDGIWDVMSNEDCAKFIQDEVKRGVPSLGQVRCARRRTFPRSRSRTPRVCDHADAPHAAG